MFASERANRARLDGFELEIFKLVREHATSEQWREWLRVPLEHAAADGNVDLFTELLGAGADGSAGWRGCDGRTLLGAAAFGKSEKIVCALLEAGAQPDLYVKFGEKQESALHVAAANGAEEVSRALMLFGAHPNVVDWADQTPLHLAAREGHGVIVSDLLERGAYPNAETRGFRDTPLHLAGDSALCVSKLLLGGANKDSRNTNGQTPLYLAARRGRLDVVEELLAAKADLNIRANDDHTPVDIAAMSGNSGVLRELLRHGGDSNARDNWNGDTALHHAVKLGSTKDNGGAVRVLLEAGADVEAKTRRHGYTALHLAILRKWSSGTMSALLEGGANVNARSTRGCTPLHLACRLSKACGVELLLRWGADETLVNKDGKTAEDEVKRRNDAVGMWAEGDDDDDDEDSDYEQDSNDEEDSDSEEYSSSDEEDSDGEEDSSEEEQDSDGEQDSDEEEDNDEENSDDDEGSNEKRRKDTDQRIRDMLARAPAYRSWCRRGWLVLARSCPAKVRLANGSRSSDRGSSTKVAKARCDSSGGGNGGDGEQAMVDFGSLVRRVVGLDAEGVFRLVVGFL